MRDAVKFVLDVALVRSVPDTPFLLNIALATKATASRADRLTTVAGLPPGQIMLELNAGYGDEPVTAVPFGRSTTRAPFGAVMLTWLASMGANWMTDPSAL